LEITGGLLTHYNPDGSLRYEVFEPSETLASGAILSLEEKFLAGEGQNLTPARFTTSKLPQLSHEMISSQVRATLQKAAAVLGVTGYARIDAFVRIFADAKVETLIIEVNSLPGMTPATCIFHQCALNGYKPYEFIDAILKFGQQRQQQAQA
jgi:D-alanine-D-alanine ligase